MTPTAARTVGQARQIRYAWLEYLTETRLAGDPSYAEVEPWAWTRLQRRLDEIEAGS